MTIKTLQDLYIDQLQDITSADHQARAMTEKLAAAATNPHLDSALRAGVEGIDRGIGAVGSVLAQHGRIRHGRSLQGNGRSRTRGAAPCSRTRISPMTT